MRKQGVYDWPGAQVLEGKWQDWLLNPERMTELAQGEVLEFDAMFFDTFAEGYGGLSIIFLLLEAISY